MVGYDLIEFKIEVQGDDMKDVEKIVVAFFGRARQLQN